MTTTLPTNLGLANAVNLDRPRFLVSYSFEAPDAAAAQVATDELEAAMRDDERLPVFTGLAFFKPVQVATNVAPASTSKKVLRLDPGEVSDLMAALMVAIESVEDDDAEDAHLYDNTEQTDAYRALADKLLVAQRDGIA